jgi:hypothetical protein
LGPDVVLFVHDYHDQPRSGVCTYGGAPHLFDCVFDADDAVDDYTNHYDLTPLSAERLALEAERHEMGKAWCAALLAGEESLRSMPALPEHMVRMAEILLLRQADDDQISHRTFRVRGEMPLISNSNYKAFSDRRFALLWGQ